LLLLLLTTTVCSAAAAAAANFGVICSGITAIAASNIQRHANHESAFHLRLHFIYNYTFPRISQRSSSENTGGGGALLSSSSADPVTLHLLPLFGALDALAVLSAACWLHHITQNPFINKVTGTLLDAAVRLSCSFLSAASFFFFSSAALSSAFVA
jgi:hypothetical protein